MNKKYIFYICFYSIFFNCFSINAMKLFNSTKKERDLSSYNLPNEEILKNLGVEQGREIVSADQIQVDLDDYDQDYYDAFNSLNQLKRSEYDLVLGNGARLVLDFKSEKILRQFISKIYEIANGLRTTILHVLVELKCVNNLKPCIEFLQKYKDDFDFHNIDASPQCDLTYFAHKNLTPLFYAVLLNDFEKAKALIDQGASIYVRNKFGYSLLHIAIFHKNAEMVKLILYKFKKDKENKSHIPFDVLNDIKNFILKGHKIIRICHSPLHFAVWRGNIDVLKIILAEDDLKINLQDNAKQTPLHILVRNYIQFSEYRMNSEAIAGRLLAKGANPKIKDKNGSNPACYLDYSEGSQLKSRLYDGHRFFRGWLS